MNPEVPGRTREFFRFQFPSHKRFLHLVRDVVYRLSLQAGLEASAAFEVKLICGEAISNIIKHAYEDKDDESIFLEYYFRPDHVELLLKDLGLQKPIRPEMAADLTDYREKGLGLFLIRELSDYHFFDQTGKVGTTLVIKKKRPL